MTIVAVAKRYHEGFSTAGEILGLVALFIFLVFSAWIVLQRFKSRPSTDADPQQQTGHDREGSDV